jgi:hypothetical protein
VESADHAQMPSENAGYDLVGDHMGMHDAESGPIDLLGTVPETFLQ